jgi:hypothetical protein
MAVAWVTLMAVLCVSPRTRTVQANAAQKGVGGTSGCIEQSRLFGGAATRLEGPPHTHKLMYGGWTAGAVDVCVGVEID